MSKIINSNNTDVLLSINQLVLLLKLSLIEDKSPKCIFDFEKYLVPNPPNVVTRKILKILINNNILQKHSTKRNGNVQLYIIDKKLLKEYIWNMDVIQLSWGFLDKYWLMFK